MLRRCGTADRLLLLGDLACELERRVFGWAQARRLGQEMLPGCAGKWLLAADCGPNYCLFQKKPE